MASTSALAAARSCLQCARIQPRLAARRGISTSAVVSQQQRKLATMVDAPHHQRSPPSTSSPFSSPRQQPLSQPSVAKSRQGTTTQLDTEGHDITASRLTAPIKLTNLFDRLGHDNFVVTPEIGQEFPKGQLDLAAILASEDSPQNDELLRELASLVSHRGVVFVRGQHNLTQDLLHKLAHKIGVLSGRPHSSKLHVHPLTKDEGENAAFKGEKISSEPDAEGRQISFPDEKSELASSGWHSDIPFENVPSDYAILQIRTLPATGGDTLWSSQYAAYDALSDHMKRFLEGLTATNDAEAFRSQASRGGFSLYTRERGSPLNTGDHLRASHPVIRTNPVTGWKGLYVNQFFTKRINELTKDESENVLQYLFRHQAQNYNHHVRFKWEKDDVAIWDNRSTMHTGIFDIGKAKRDGDRTCSLGEKPFYDPNSKSRKADLGL